MSNQQQPLSQNGTGVQPVSDRVTLEAILKEISTRLVIPSDRTTASEPSRHQASDYIQMMVFRLGNQTFGLDVLTINEVMRSPHLTHVPGLPGWVLGITNFHGEIISVVHLAQFLGINRTRTGGEVVVLVAQTADQRIGLVVDDVETIFTTLADQVASPSFRIDPGIVPYLRGAVERNGEFVRLLHSERLLLGEQMQQFS